VTLLILVGAASQHPLCPICAGLVCKLTCLSGHRQ
jgi:hypothetical protein